MSHSSVMLTRRSKHKRRRHSRQIKTSAKAVRAVRPRHSAAPSEKRRSEEAPPQQRRGEGGEQGAEQRAPGEEQAPCRRLRGEERAISAAGDAAGGASRSGAEVEVLAGRASRGRADLESPGRRCKARPRATRGGSRWRRSGRARTPCEPHRSGAASSRRRRPTRAAGTCSGRGAVRPPSPHGGGGGRNALEDAVLEGRRLGCRLGAASEQRLAAGGGGGRGGGGAGGSQDLLTRARVKRRRVDAPAAVWREEAPRRRPRARAGQRRSWRRRWRWRRWWSRCGAARRSAQSSRRRRPRDRCGRCGAVVQEEASPPCAEGHPSREERRRQHGAQRLRYSTHQ